MTIKTLRSNYFFEPRKGIVTKQLKDLSDYLQKNKLSKNLFIINVRPVSAIPPLYYGQAINVDINRCEALAPYMKWKSLYKNTYAYKEKNIKFEMESSIVRVSIKLKNSFYLKNTHPEMVEVEFTPVWNKKFVNFGFQIYTALDDGFDKENPPKIIIETKSSNFFFEKDEKQVIVDFIPSKFHSECSNILCDFYYEPKKFSFSYKDGEMEKGWGTEPIRKKYPIKRWKEEFAYAHKRSTAFKWIRNVGIATGLVEILMRLFEVLSLPYYGSAISGSLILFGTIQLLLGWREIRKEEQKF